MNKGVLASRAAEFRKSGEDRSDRSNGGDRKDRDDRPVRQAQGRSDGGDGAKRGWKVTAPLGDNGEPVTFYARTKKELPRMPDGTVFEKVRFTDEELEKLPGAPAELIF